ADVYKKMPQDFLEDPDLVFKRNIHISPFWEEDLGALAELVGVDRVLFGSDYPHPEGLAEPASYLDELRGLPEATVRKIMGGNLARLMNVEDAVVRCPRSRWTASRRRSRRWPPGTASGWRSSTATPGSRGPTSTPRPGRSAPPSLPPASRRATGWPSGRPTAPSGSSPRSASSGRGPSWSRSTRASRAPRPPTSCPAA